VEPCFQADQALDLLDLEALRQGKKGRKIWAFLFMLRSRLSDFAVNLGKILHALL
jgi:hypothetical protein